MDIAYSVVLLAAVYAVSEKRQLFTIALVLAIPIIAARWLNYFLQNDLFALVSKSLTILFLIFIAITVLFHVLKDEEVTADKIYGALVVYLLIGFTWALLFTVIEGIRPQSFLIGDLQRASIRDMSTHFTYYSFVTLTTLGYGDITPLTPAAKTFSFMEAVFGQIYIAVLIARLVGLHIAYSMKKDSS
ncbi:MAG: potassium channel family protein [candidate division NC10 bacterium]|nr:potassium channel family protein [candidate division NC10 bacterium]